MATSSGFISTDDLQTEYQCAFCKREYDVPKVIPCGESICTYCESDYFQGEECPLCSQDHEIPINGFPVNNFLLRLRKKTLKKIYRGEFHKKATEKINEVCSLNHDFEIGLKKLDSIVIDYCDLLRENIDLRTESAIDAIQKHREKLISEVYDYQKKCLGKSANLNEYKEFMTQSKELYRKWAHFLNCADLKDKEIDDVLKESSELVTKLEYTQKKLDLYVFGEQKIHFCANESDISSKIIGKLSDFYSGLNSMFENKPKSVINYKTYVEEVTYSNPILIPIDNNEKLCLVVSMKYNPVNITPNMRLNIVQVARPDDNNYLKLKLFSKNGNMIKEISEISKNLQFIASKFKDSIIVAYESNKEMLMKMYDHTLKMVKSLNTESNCSAMFTDENKIYIHSKNVLKIYDENLDQLESISIGYGEEKYPFISNYATQIELKYGRLFISLHLQLRVVDNETRKTIKTLLLNAKYAYRNLIVKPISSDTFMVVDKVSKEVNVFDLNMNCVMEFKIKNINEISSISINDDNSIVIYDHTVTKTFLF